MEHQEVVAAAGTIVLAVLTALLVLPVSALPVAGLGLLGGGAALVLGWHGSRRAEASFVAERAALSDEVVATLQSARQLVLWGADEEAIGRTGAIGARLATTVRATTRGLAAARAVLLVLTAVAVAGTAWLAAPALADGRVSGPMTAMLVLLPLALHDVLTTLPDAAATAVRTRAARSRLDALERLVPAVTEPAEPVPAAASYDVHLDHAALGWTDRPVVELDLHLPAGASLGIVGPSGCGKSTVAATLVRHLAPLDGRYRLGGTDAQNAGSAEVRRHVGLVDDDPYVFASSVRENLRLAAPGADDAAVVEALAAAGLGDWYAGLRHGLDTLLGDGATGVSGGERARLGIARALLADPDVLVLDEPTAHLDSATARAVTDTVLGARGRGRSLVWITHEEVGLADLDAVLDLGARPATPSATGPLPGGAVTHR